MTAKRRRRDDKNIIYPMPWISAATARCSAISALAKTATRPVMGDVLRAAVSAFLVLLGSSAAVAAADPVRGEEVFHRCQLCHNAVKGGSNGLGPNLFGVVGRKAAAVPNFSYSGSLKKSNIVWSEEMLRKWVTNPQKLVPGTRMVFAGIRKAQEVDDLIAYLKTRK
jgi:cytochrome c